MTKDEFYKGLTTLGFNISIPDREVLWSEMAMNAYDEAITYTNFSDALRYFYENTK